MENFQRDFIKLLKDSQVLRDVVNSISYYTSPRHSSEMNHFKFIGSLAFILLRERFLLNYLIYLAKNNKTLKTRIYLDANYENFPDGERKPDTGIIYNNSDESIEVYIGSNDIGLAASRLALLASKTLSDYMLDIGEVNKKDPIDNPRSNNFAVAFLDSEKGEQLPRTLRVRLMNNEFLSEITKEHDFDAEDAGKIMEQLKENAKEEIQKKLNSAKMDYQSLQNRMDEVLKEIHTFQEKLNHIDVKDSSERFQRVLKDKRIESIKVIEKNLVIHTRPIKLSYDEKKAQKIPRIKNLPEGSALYIGRHKLNINFRTLSYETSPLDRFRNQHIQNFACYGNFSSELNEARKENKLDKIISLLLQAVQHVTIGDPAGRDTIEKAYVVTKENAVLHKNKLIPHLKFLDLINNYDEEAQIYFRNQKEENQNTASVEELDNEESIRPF